MMTKGKSVYFFIMTMMFWYATCTFNPIISPYAAELNATGVMIGLIGGAYGISQTVLRIPLGFLSDKTDKRKIFILIGTLCSGIAGLIVVLFRSPMSLFLCRIMTGVQAATWVQLTVLYSSMCKPEEAGKAMALMVTACSAGKMLASLTGGFASELYGYTAPFWMMIPACVIAFVMCFGLKDVKLRRTTDKIRISELLKRSFQRNILIICIVSTAFNYVTSASNTFIPLFAKELGAAKYELGFVTTLICLAGMAGSSLSDKIGRKLGIKRSIFINLILLVVSYCFAIPFVDNLYILYIMVFIGGFNGYLLVSQNLGLILKNVDPSYKSSVVSFYQSFYGLGMIFGPILTGFIRDTIGINAGYIVIGFIELATAFISLYYKPSLELTAKQ